MQIATIIMLISKNDEFRKTIYYINKENNFFKNILQKIKKYLFFRLGKILLYDLSDLSLFFDYNYFLSIYIIYFIYINNYI